ILLQSTLLFPAVRIYGEQHAKGIALASIFGSGISFLHSFLLSKLIPSIFNCNSLLISISTCPGAVKLIINFGIPTVSNYIVESNTQRQRIVFVNFPEMERLAIEVDYFLHGFGLGH